MPEADQGSRYADYFAAAAELEGLATKICEFAPAVVPGLLQTAEYARAVTIASNPLASDEYIEETVRREWTARSILKDATRPVYWAILHETALRIPVGGPGSHGRQLDHIAALARERKDWCRCSRTRRGRTRSWAGC